METCLFSSIRSNLMIYKIFNNLNQKTLFEIIHYNKYMQKRLNKDINSYKNFLKIEIEIIPEEIRYGKFINISSNESYYHIYFNKSKEEINRTKIYNGEIISKIKIIIDAGIKSLSELFKYCKCIKKINFTKFNIRDITDMNNMFSNCTSLKEINLSNIYTNNVIDMSNMFNNCYSLKELNLSYFNTNDVENMSFMFSNCSSLEELNLSKFNTNKVIFMCSMFKGCKSLKK